MIGTPLELGNEKKRALLGEALAKLEETAGIKAKGVRLERPHGQDRANPVIDFDGPLKPHWVAMKGELTPARLGLALEALLRLPQPCLLFAPYVTPPMALRLRQEGVQFLDAQGNAFLDQKAPRVLIWVTGNRPEKARTGEKPLRAFHAAGLKVIFPLLCLQDEAKTATYRDLAKWAGVALGTVAKTLDELKHLGYIRKAKGNRVFTNRARLLEAWADAYPRELRPGLDVRRFRTDRKEWWTNADWTLLGAWLGGEPAAAMLTKHLHPAFATVYAAGGLTELARALRLAKAVDGNVEVLQKFWYFDQDVPAAARLVPPLLVYADLMATGEARNIETAGIIKERFLG